MINDMKKEGMRDFRGETRVTNYPMQKVFSDFDLRDFRNVETLKGYYDNPTEDALRYHLII